MGNSASRIDRFYGNYEKSFDRIEKDVLRLKGQVAARCASRASVRTWTSALVVLALAAALSVVYQVRQQPAGTFTYQQHFNRVGGALALPVAALLLHWLVGWGLSVRQRRDARKLQRLEEAKRSMLKELKDMSRFDKIKTLIEKFDPDARHIQAVAAHHGARGVRGTGAAAAVQGPGVPRQQQQMPALLAKGSGQVAGAAALAVAGAGRALMPLVDKLATSLISDNPVLLEDLRRAQQQLADAEVRTMSAVQENLSVRHENLDLKQRLVELEKQLSLPPSFGPDALQEAQQALHQQAQQMQQAAWQVAQQQEYLHGRGPLSGDGSGPVHVPSFGSDMAAAATAAGAQQPGASEGSNHSSSSGSREAAAAGAGDGGGLRNRKQATTAAQ